MTGTLHFPGDVGADLDRLLTLIETAHAHGDETAIVEQAAKLRASLTPSALSGDAGEVERLEHARIALQRVRDRFTNIGNSSPLWCDMAEDMDAYAAEGLDRSKARG